MPNVAFTPGMASYLFSLNNQIYISQYRIDTHRKIASAIASQNWIKIICDYFDFLFQNWDSAGEGECRHG